MEWKLIINKVVNFLSLCSIWTYLSENVLKCLSSEIYFTIYYPELGLHIGVAWAGQSSPVQSRPVVSQLKPNVPNVGSGLGSDQMYYSFLKNMLPLCSFFTIVHH